MWIPDASGSWQDGQHTPGGTRTSYDVLGEPSLARALPQFHLEQAILSGDESLRKK